MPTAAHMKERMLVVYVMVRVLLSLPTVTGTPPSSAKSARRLKLISNLVLFLSKELTIQQL
jgi:hypothetical protein